MRWVLVVFLVLLGSLTRADVVVANKTIRANTVLNASDVDLSGGVGTDGFGDISRVIGMESRVVLYAGRPILPEHLTRPALIQRNQIVPILFVQSGLTISTQGRALDRGAEGELIRVMNLSSHSTLFGTVMRDGRVSVAN